MPTINALDFTGKPCVLCFHRLSYLAHIQALAPAPNPCISIDASCVRSKNEDMTVKRNALAFGRFVPCVQISSICSNELRDVVDDFGSLPVEEFINRSVCFSVHRICNNISDAHTAEVLTVRIFNSILAEVAHHIGKGNLRHSIQRKDKLHDLYLLWNGFIHTGFDALHNGVFQFKPIRDSAAHVEAFSTA